MNLLLPAPLLIPLFCAILSLSLFIRQPAFAGQHPVQQDHVGQHGIQLALRAVAVFRPEGLEPVVSQVDRNQLGNRGFVLHDEDTGKLSHGESAPRTYSTADSISSRAVWRTSLPLTR